MEPFFNVNLLLSIVNDSLHWLQARIAEKNTANLTPTNYTSAAPLAALDMNHPTNALNPAAAHPHSSDCADSTEHIFAKGPTVPTRGWCCTSAIPTPIPSTLSYPDTAPDVNHTALGSKGMLLAWIHTFTFLLEISLNQVTLHIVIKLLWDCCQLATRIPDQRRVWFKASLGFSAILIQG